MSRFKVGDKVKIIGSLTEAGKAKIGQVGEILDIDWKDGACFVLYPKGQDWVREVDLALFATHSDPKREFLERLQSLMREFDAKINIGVNVESKIGNCGVIFDLGNDRIFFPVVFSEEEYDPTVVAKRSFTNYPITADNIMDFDKE